MALVSRTFLIVMSRKIIPVTSKTKATSAIFTRDGNAISRNYYFAVAHQIFVCSTSCAGNTATSEELKKNEKL